MNEEQQRIRGYLQSQAAKLSLPELTTKVRGDMEQLREAINAVPVGSFAARPADGEWCANEILAHLTNTSASLATDIATVIESGQAPAALRDQMVRTGEHGSADEWWSRLVTPREALIERVLQAKGDEHLDVTWDHPMFGDLNWREWVLFLRIHDLDHARQLQGLTSTLSS